MYYVYILKSLSGDHTYVGSTENVDKRLNEHNTGITKSTKAFLPWQIVYTEEYYSREEALKREKYLKTGAGRRFRKQLFAIAQPRNL